MTHNVNILSHTREKYQSIVSQNQKKEGDLQEIGNQLKKVKKELGKLKEDREKIDKENQKLKQKTGIVRKASLKNEYDDRTAELEMLKLENQELS